MRKISITFISLLLVIMTFSTSLKMDHNNTVSISINEEFYQQANASNYSVLRMAIIATLTSWAMTIAKIGTDNLSFLLVDSIKNKVTSEIPEVCDIQTGNCPNWLEDAEEYLTNTNQVNSLNPYPSQVVLPKDIVSELISTASNYVNTVNKNNMSTAGYMFNYANSSYINLPYNTTTAMPFFTSTSDGKLGYFNGTSWNRYIILNDIGHYSAHKMTKVISNGLTYLKLDLYLNSEHIVRYSNSLSPTYLAYLNYDYTQLVWSIFGGTVKQFQFVFFNKTNTIFPTTIISMCEDVIPNITGCSATDSGTYNLDPSWMVPYVSTNYMMEPFDNVINYDDFNFGVSNYVSTNPTYDSSAIIQEKLITDTFTQPMPVPQDNEAPYVWNPDGSTIPDYGDSAVIPDSPALPDVNTSPASSAESVIDGSFTTAVVRWFTGTFGSYIGDLFDALFGGINELGFMMQSFFGDFWDNIKSMFIPTNLDTKFLDLKTYFENKLGMLLFPFTFLFDYYTRFSTITGLDRITFNAFYFYGQTLIPSFYIDFGEIRQLHIGFDYLFVLTKIILTGILIFNFINYLLHNFDRVIGGTKE